MWHGGMEVRRAVLTHSQWCSCENLGKGKGSVSVDYWLMSRRSENEKALVAPFVPSFKKFLEYNTALRSRVKYWGFHYIILLCVTLGSGRVGWGRVESNGVAAWYF